MYTVFRKVTKRQNFEAKKESVKLWVLEFEKVFAERLTLQLEGLVCFKVKSAV